MADLFSEPNVKSDIVLIVEDKRMYVSKTILSLASPVFEEMFESDLKGEHDAEIPLPGKKYDDFLEFLLCFYPHSMKPVTFDNVETVLPLADEFQVEYIKRKSEETLLRTVEEMALSDKELLHILLMADKYGLSKARAVAINNVGMCTYETLAKDDGFAVLRSTLKVDILLEQNSKLLKEINSLQSEIATLNKMPLVDCKIFHHFEKCGKCRTCASCVGEILRARTGAFGANTSTSSGGLFGQSPTAQTGFGIATSTAATGGLFSQTPTQATVFGQSRPGAFGTNTSTSSGGLFGQSPTAQTGFGIVTSTAATGGLFSQTPTQATVFGQSRPGAFGTNTSTSSGGLFGQTQTAQTGGLFGASKPLFVNTATSTGTGFGFGQSQTGLFRNKASVFGDTKTTSSPDLGFATASRLFGKSRSSASTFGFGTGSFGIATSTAATGGFFSHTPTQAIAFGQSRPDVETRYQCITAMQEYENKSLEELRMEDYLANRKENQDAATGVSQLVKKENSPCNITVLKSETE